MHKARYTPAVGLLLCLFIGMLFGCKPDWPTLGTNRLVLVKGKAFVINRLLSSNYRIQADTAVPAPRGSLVTVESQSGRALGETFILDDQGNFQLSVDLDQAGIRERSTGMLFTTLHNQSHQAIAGAPLVIDPSQSAPPPPVGDRPRSTLEVQIDALRTFMLLAARAAAAEHRDVIAVVQEAQRRTEDEAQRQVMTNMAENLMASTADHPEQVDRLLRPPSLEDTGTNVLAGARQSAESGAQQQTNEIAEAIRIAQEIINLSPVLPYQPGEPLPPTGDIKVDVGVENGPNVLVTSSPR